ncbi:5-methylcytosine-specific restriction endonuclease system specificity protein McrC [Mycolicibacterium brisbanense]|uniref:McrC protein n=1 Tax=Mycolicibacterium brisbanense TaxID=146020 RepID=A0A124E141_9MYCO|nr:5-methylcytosine-specific restriction endonuclease system specificity protein McrC [Mycolicibacterium brisbanense]GAS92475.1 McrC protein [Mycolicibacterium brisbanense]
MTGVVFSGKTEIPVRNLWLLMLYASELYASNADVRDAGAEHRPDDLPDLVAEILAQAVERRLQRSLSRSYIGRRQPLTRVRGRIDVLETESAQLLSRGQIACKYSELAIDNPVNRLVYAGLIVAAATARDTDRAHRCRQLAGMLRLQGVTATLASRSDADSITLGRNQVADLDGVNAARLLLRMDIPSEDTGAAHRMSALRDAADIRHLYETAVRGFYRATLQPPWRVRAGETVHTWPLHEQSAGALAILPVMRTDTMLERPDRRIIVETKFADALKTNRFGTPRLSRNHMFQLYAYVQSQHNRDLLGATAEGVLLYPVVHADVDEYAVIGGHRYRFITVDLAAETPAIRERLLSVVADQD